MTFLTKAMHMAAAHHADQVDKAGKPYLMHLLWVAGRCATELAMTVALLHDIVEDTSVTLEVLRSEFDEEIADAVDHLTKREREVYGEYIERVMENPVAAYVKVRDIIHHLRGEQEADLAVGLRSRYRLAYKKLTGLNWDKVKHLPD
jgi:(p)ppGpp synthase/HD superfamily hydrolase